MRAFKGLALVAAMAGPGLAQDSTETLEAQLASVAKSAAPFAVGMGYQFVGDEPQWRVAGTQHRWSDVPVAEDALWHVGSITKSFTATLIMQLQAEGRLDVTAPIATYLQTYVGQFHPSWGEITLDELMRHVAGMPVTDGFTWQSDAPRQQRIEALRTVWELPIEVRGTQQYSNLGYVLAGVIAEEVTDTAWRDLVRTRIAEPLGMTSVGFGAPVTDGSPWGHHKRMGLRFPVDPETDGADNPEWMGPAGRLHMSIADLLRWGSAHQAACSGVGETLLPQAACLQMRASVEDTHGYGWVTQFAEAYDQPVVWHNGSNTMWYAMLIMFPESNLSVAMAMNASKDSLVDAASAELAAAVLGIELLD
ncbi:serine hydrolase [Cognatishimia sp. MH4019]|uniref:serine hydrolase domain-containing protein n=1 Tax=Cognatishimia sp. MH4019 TaxID=2854030 RepID=UPI001CD50CA9|nr:serine hydrolase domain-containing protein [Cognatishimia sp. MH4019]